MAEEKYDKSRSIRIGDDTWERGSKRARAEGTTISKVLRAFAEAYAAGVVDAPRRVVQYVQG